MALVKLGGGVTAISGSIGGNTFARSKAGAYVRQRTKPVNPRSSLQVTRRANAAFLATYWSKTLTAQQRTDWRDYATGTTWTNKLGETIEIGGNAAMMRLNTFAKIIGYPIQAEAPLAMGHAGGVTFTFSAENDTAKIQVDEPGGAFDKDTAHQNLGFFMGLPTEPGRLATPKGFQYIGLIAGDAVAPPAFPYQLDAAHRMVAGQLVTIRVMFKDESQRMSGPFWATATAAPA